MLRSSFKHKRFQPWFFLTWVITTNGGSAEKATEQRSLSNRVDSINSVVIDQAHALQQKRMSLT